MTGTRAEVFVDTNVLIHARDTADAVKQARAAEWIAYLWRSGRGRLSVQVLNEFYLTVTQKLRPGLEAEAARREIEQIMAWGPIALTTSVLQRAWRLQDDSAVSFWDALIVAAAQVARCRYLLTEDLQDGQELGGVVVLNPFLHELEEIHLPRAEIRADPDTDEITGLVPVDDRLEIHVTTRNPGDPARVGKALTGEVPVGPDGRFHLDLTGRFDLRGGDRVEARLFTRAGHRIVRAIQVPVLDLSLDNGWITGNLPRPAIDLPVTATLRRSGALVARGSGVSDWFGYTLPPLRDDAGVSVVPQAEVAIGAHTPNSAFYGVTTLLELVTADGAVPGVFIVDYPSQAVRGTYEPTNAVFGWQDGRSSAFMDGFHPVTPARLRGEAAGSVPSRPAACRSVPRWGSR